MKMKSDDAKNNYVNLILAYYHCFYVVEPPTYELDIPEDH
jgi:hypothetical protein